MFERLPHDVLQHCFPPEPLPLKEAARRWHTLEGTCRAVAEALPELRVAVTATLPLPAACLPWLQARAVVLHLLPDSEEDYGSDNGNFWAALVQREECWWTLGEGTAAPAPAPAAPGSLDGLPALSACLALEELCVLCPKMRSDETPQPTFDTAPLAALPRLRRLALEKFLQFNLRGLPPTLRVLRAVGASIWGMSWATLVALALPEGCRLECAQLTYSHLDRNYDGETSEEEGFTVEYCMRLPLWRVWPSCRQLETDVEYVCLGPPPADAGSVVQTTDVGPLLDALLAGMAGASLLRRLSLDPETLLGLPGGQLAQAAALASPSGRAQLGAHPAGQVLSVEEGESEGVLVRLRPPEEVLGVRPRRAPRVVVTSHAPPPSL